MLVFIRNKALLAAIGVVQALSTPSEEGGDIITTFIALDLHLELGGNVDSAMLPNVLLETHSEGRGEGSEVTIHVLDLSQVDEFPSECEQGVPLLNIVDAGLKALFDQRFVGAEKGGLDQPVRGEHSLHRCLVGEDLVL